MVSPRALARRQERRIFARFPVTKAQARILAALAYGEARTWR